MLVWLIGKPGTGKTTVGKLVEQVKPGRVYYSFSDLLKKFQPDINKDGFTQDTRDEVYSFLSKESKIKTVIVSGNPYTKNSFNEMNKINQGVIVFNFEISDNEAVKRLMLRGREVFKHDGNSEKERLDGFNKKVLPEIEKITKNKKVHTLDVENKTPLEVKKIVEALLMINY